MHGISSSSSDYFNSNQFFNDKSKTYGTDHRTIAANAEVKITKGGKELTAFSVALNRSYKKKDGELVKRTTFCKCAYWRNTSIAPHLQKGMIVTVFGNLDVESYKKRDGDFIANLVCHVDRIDFHTGKKEKTEAEPVIAGNVTKDDLPF